MLEFLDSFDGYSTAEISFRYHRVSGGGGAQIINGGRNGKGILIGPGNSVTRTTSYNNAWVVGFAFYFDPNNGSQAGTIYQASTPNMGNIIEIFGEPDGSLSLRTGDGGTLIANTGDGFALHGGTWYYIELKFNTAGSTNVSVTGQLRVNKQTVIPATSGFSGYNINGTLTNTNRINEHSLSVFGGARASGATFDDYYIFTQDGTVNNDFAGDVRLGVIKTISDVNSNFTPSRPGTLWNLINEIPPDYDTTYISSNVNETFQNFNWEHIPSFLGSVLCVQYTLFARKDDEGSRAFQHTMGNGPDVLSTQHYIGDTYLYFMAEFDTGPGGAEWTVALFNSTTFGIKVFTIPVPS